MFPPYRKSPTITSTHSLLFRWISLLPLELGLRKKMWTTFIRRYKYTKEDYVYKKVWIQMKKQFEPMSHLIPLNIKRPFQRSCQKTLYKHNHSKCSGVARRAWSSHDGSTRYFNLIFQTRPKSNHRWHGKVFGWWQLCKGHCGGNNVQGSTDNDCGGCQVVVTFFVVVVDFFVFICTFYIFLAFALACSIFPFWRCDR